jgi:hypothetical protein
MSELAIKSGQEKKAKLPIGYLIKNIYKLPEP